MGLYAFTQGQRVPEWLYSVTSTGGATVDCVFGCSGYVAVSGQEVHVHAVGRLPHEYVFGIRVSFGQLQNADTGHPAGTHLLSIYMDSDALEEPPTAPVPTIDPREV